MIFADEQTALLVELLQTRIEAASGALDGLETIMALDRVRIIQAFRHEDAEVRVLEQLALSRLLHAEYIEAMRCALVKNPTACGG